MLVTCLFVGLGVANRLVATPVVSNVSVLVGVRKLNKDGLMSTLDVLSFGVTGVEATVAPSFFGTLAHG